MDTLLTVITPCVNGKEYVRRVMASVAPQLTDECEMILVDDSTTDGTGELCESFASDKVTVIHGKYGNQADSRNAAVARARGEYVWFIDFDDFIEPEAVRIVTEALKESRPDILRFTHCEDEDGRITKIPQMFVSGVYTGEGLYQIQRFAMARTHTAPFYIWLQIYRTELLRQTPLLPPRQYLSESNSLVLRIYPRAEKIHIIDDMLYHFVQRPDSAGHVTRFLPSYPAMNLYRAVRDDLSSVGLYEKFRNVFAYNIMNTVILRLFDSSSGAFTIEYRRSNSLETAREHIRDILASPDFKELLANAKRKDDQPVQRIIYQLMEAEDEEKLYKLLMSF